MEKFKIGDIVTGSKTAREEPDFSRFTWPWRNLTVTQVHGAVITTKEAGQIHTHWLTPNLWEKFYKKWKSLK